MPVVSVAVPTHPQIGTILTEVADAVADALGLGVGDVITVHTPTSASVTNGETQVEAPAAWHIITIQGSDRGSEPMRRALAAAEASVREWCRSCGIRCEGVWTQWLMSGSR